MTTKEAAKFARESIDRMVNPYEKAKGGKDVYESANALIERRITIASGICSKSCVGMVPSPKAVALAADAIASEIEQSIFDYINGERKSND